jgi:hypothetical protein
MFRSIIIGISTLFVSQNAFAICNIYNKDKTLIVKVAPNGKVGKYNASTNSYKVISISYQGGGVRYVDTYEGDNVTSAAGRVSLDGKVYDEKQVYMGLVRGDGKIENHLSVVIGFYDQCETLPEELRNELVGAGASRLLMFDPSVHYYEYRVFQYCEPSWCNW